ncbi:pentatricopeptide repeat-containing protein [Canna indica]|uniref:Pentatricopeptide repeat-containing protein n=1 Tax=Canna indica TaxID=4628 RepID=A0AAQ3QK78_9LILI|nr:pentatricopeptide repeat-containing protein [Canna indica]
MAGPTQNTSSRCFELLRFRPTTPTASPSRSDLPWIPQPSRRRRQPPIPASSVPPSLSNASVLRAVSGVGATPRQILAVYSAAARQPGFRHDLATYKALTSALSLHRSFRAVELLLARMPRDGLRPGPALVLPLLHAYFSAGRSLDALLRACPFPLSERLLSSLVNSLLQTNDLEIAGSLLLSAAELGFPVMARHYSSLVRAHCDRDGVRSAVEFLDLLVTRGCVPDVFFYGSFIRDICRRRSGESVDAAFEVLAQMKRSGREPDVVIWNTLVHGCATAGQLDRAEKLVAEMESNSCSTTDAGTYNALISAIPDRQMIKDGILAIRGMVEKGVSPDVVTFSLLIGGLGRAGRVWECNAMLGMMLRLGISPDITCYKILLGVYRRKKMKNDVSSILDAMKNDGFSVDEETKE